MGSIFNAGMYRTFTLCVTASSFVACTIATPIQAYQQCKAQVGINFNDIAFVARIEKLIEKVKKYQKKLESGKLIEVMLDIKTEVEAYTGREIDIDSQLDQIERDAINQGAQFKKGEMKQIRSILKKKAKKQNHRVVYLAECNMYDIPFDQDQCDFLYKSANKHDDKEEKTEESLPVRVTVGVTAALCGYFLKFIPHPLCQMASNFLISAGVLMATEGTITRYEEDQKEKGKDKK